MKNNDKRYYRKIIKVQAQLDKAVAHEKKINKIVKNLKTKYNTSSKNVHLLDCCLDYLADRVKIIQNKKNLLNNKLTKIINNNKRNYYKIIEVQVQFDKAVAHEKKVNKIVENLETEYNIASKNVYLFDCCLDYLIDRVKIILNKRDSLNSDIAKIRMKYAH